MAVAAAQVNNFFIVMCLEKRKVFIHSFMAKIICLGTIHILRQLFFVFFDQLATSRFSADPISLAVAAAQVNNFFIKSVHFKKTVAQSSFLYKVRSF